MSNYEQRGQRDGDPSLNLNNKYKETDNSESDEDDYEEESQYLSHDIDLGHLEADRILEKRRLEILQEKNEEICKEKEDAERKEIEAEREEDRRDLTNTYRRFR